MPREVPFVFSPIYLFIYFKNVPNLCYSTLLIHEFPLEEQAKGMIQKRIWKEARATIIVFILATRSQTN